MYKQAQYFQPPIGRQTNTLKQNNLKPDAEEAKRNSAKSKGGNKKS
jgi:hypothetical protein